jgi:hypothetical protein
MTRRSRWLIQLVPATLGAVILVATMMAGRILSGVVWFAVLSAIGALSPVIARFDAARRGRGDDGDEREAIVNARAMSIVGTVLVIAITGCAAFTLARGESTSPYTALLAVGGISYVIAFLALRYGKS